MIGAPLSGIQVWSDNLWPRQQVPICVNWRKIACAYRLEEPPKSIYLIVNFKSTDKTLAWLLC